MKNIFRKLVNIKQDDMKTVFHFNAKANEKTMIKYLIKLEPMQLL